MQGTVMRTPNDKDRLKREVNGPGRHQSPMEMMGNAVFWAHGWQGFPIEGKAESYKPGFTKRCRLKV